MRDKLGRLASLLICMCICIAGCARVQGENSVVTYGALSMSLPDGFQASTTKGLYLSDAYPEDLSNIYLYTEPMTEGASLEALMSQEEARFVQNLQDAYEKQYEERPEIIVESYEKAEVAGKEAWKVELQYSLEDVVYHQIEYVIAADQMYYVAFSALDSEAHEAAFASAIDSISF